MKVKYNYAHRTNEQKENILKSFEQNLAIHGKFAEPGHLTSCVAHDAYRLTSRQWNKGKAGPDAFASTLATLVMSGKIKLVFSDEVKEKFGLK